MIATLMHKNTSFLVGNLAKSPTISSDSRLESDIFLHQFHQPELFRDTLDISLSRAL